MSKALFKANTEPKVMPPGTPLPEPGPNAYEVAVVSYDPDQNMLVVSINGGSQALAKLDEMPQEGQKIELLLKDHRLGPKVDLHIFPAKQMPKFASPEEADAWLEANS